VLLDQKRELETRFNRASADLRLRLMDCERRQMEIQELTHTLHTVDPDFYTREEKKRKASATRAELVKQREHHAAQLAALDARMENGVEEERAVQQQISDLGYIVELLKKQAASMVAQPRSDVRNLCGSLKTHRAVLRENARELALAQVEMTSVDREIARLEERYSPVSIHRINEKVVAMHQRLQVLKQKFNTGRNGRERSSSVILTNEEELSVIQATTAEVAGEVDVYKMRMTGLSSRVDKLLRSVRQEQIPLSRPDSER
jgi:chromosome segregation ATPase